ERLERACDACPVDAMTVAAEPGRQLVTSGSRPSRAGSATRRPEGQRSSLTAPTWARILAARCTETRVSWRAPPVVTSDIHSRLDADRYRPGGSHRVRREESVCPARAAEGGAGVPRDLRPCRQLPAFGLGGRPGDRAVPEGRRSYHRQPRVRRPPSRRPLSAARNRPPRTVSDPRGDQEAAQDPRQADRKRPAADSRQLFGPARQAV